MNPTTYVDATLLEVTKLRRAGDLDSACSLLISAVSKSQNDAKIILALAEVSLEAGKYKRSIENYLKLYKKVNETEVLIQKLLRAAGLMAPARVPRKIVVEVFDILEMFLQEASKSIRLKLAISIYDWLGITKESGVESSNIIFETYIIPTVQLLYKLKDFDAILWMEALAHDLLIKQTESEERFQYIVREFAKYTEKAGEAICRELGPPATHPKNRRVAFFIHNASTLAHIEAFLNVMRGIRENASLDIQPTLIVFGGWDESLDKACGSLDVEVIYIDPESVDNSVVGKFKKTRSLLKEREISVLVWICLAAFLPFASSMRLATTQVWWSMKFHRYESSQIDFYLGSFFQEAHPEITERWLESYLAITPHSNQSVTKIEQTKAKFGTDRLLLATFARDEVIDSEPFLERVSQLLLRYDNLLFLWTGRTENQNIRKFFEKKNVLEQTRFIGWVDIPLYSEVIDVFIDPFPFFCGFTLLSCMAAGKPVLFSPSAGPSYKTITQAILDRYPETLSREQHLLWNSVVGFSENPSGFIEKLVTEPAFRTDVSQLNKLLIEAFFSNHNLSARFYERHFERIIDQSLGAKLS